MSGAAVNWAGTHSECNRVVNMMNSHIQHCGDKLKFTSALCLLTLFRPMEFSIKLHTIKSGWSIVYIEGSHVIIKKKNCISFSEDQFCFSKQYRP